MGTLTVSREVVYGERREEGVQEGELGSRVLCCALAHMQLALQLHPDKK